MEREPEGRRKLVDRVDMGILEVQPKPTGSS